MSIKSKHAGVFKDPSKVYANDNNVWKDNVDGYSRYLGVWQKTYSSNTAPVWTGTSLPNVSELNWYGGSATGVEINSTYVTDDKDTGNLTITLQSGTLPPGITLSESNGDYFLEGIAGNTIGGNTAYNFTLRAQDTEGAIADKLFSVTVTNDPITWTTSSGNLATVNENRSVSTSVAAKNPDANNANSGLTYTIDSGSLPPGVSMNSSGSISGTCGFVSSNTTYNFTVMASNGSDVALRSFSIIVSDTPVNWTTASGSIGSTSTNSSFSKQLVATGDVTNPTYSKVSGSYPPGLSMNSSGLISGTVTSTSSTTYNFTIRASQGGGDEDYADRAFSITNTGHITRNYTISSSQTNFNLKTYMTGLGHWQTAVASTINVTINSGVYCYATTTSNFGFDTGSGWGSVTINLDNNGYITGRGGNGASGRSTTYAKDTAVPYVIRKGRGYNGGAGGSALKVRANLNLMNSGGYVFGGGGGGASGVAWHARDSSLAAGIAGEYSRHGGSGGGGGIGGSSGGTRAYTTAFSSANTTVSSERVIQHAGNGAGGTLSAAGGAGTYSRVDFTVTSKSTVHWDYDFIGRGGAGGGWGAAGAASVDGAGWYRHRNTPSGGSTTAWTNVGYDTVANDANYTYSAVGGIPSGGAGGYSIRGMNYCTIVNGNSSGRIKGGTTST